MWDFSTCQQVHFFFTKLVVREADVSDARCLDDEHDDHEPDARHAGHWQHDGVGVALPERHTCDAHRNQQDVRRVEKYEQYTRYNQWYTVSEMYFLTKKVDFLTTYVQFTTSSVDLSIRWKNYFSWNMHGSFFLLVELWLTFLEKDLDYVPVLLEKTGIFFFLRIEHSSVVRGKPIVLQVFLRSP